MKLSERFIQRCRDELKLNLPDGTFVRRTYAGYWQRAAGAMSWTFAHKHEYIGEIGSQWSITELMKAPRLSIMYNDSGNMNEIDPEDDE